MAVITATIKDNPTVFIIYEFNYKVADFEAPKINSVEFLNKDSYELYAPYKDMEAIVYYSDSSTDYITITVDMVTNFDTSTPGEHVACVRIGDMYFDYVYYVNGDIEKVLESIDIESLPKEYHLNSNFIEVDVLAYYSDGSTDYITITVDMVTNFDTSTPGEHFDAIIVEGIEFEYIYIVLEGEEVYPAKIDPIGIKREYEQYEGFTPGEVDVYYIDGSTKKMSIDESMLIGFNTETPGDHVAYINIEGYYLEYCYTVIEKVIEEVYVVGITLENLVNEYQLNEEFHETEVIVNYSNGTEEKVLVTLDIISNFDTSTPGKHVAYVHIGDMSFDYVYYVNGE